MHVVHTAAPGLLHGCTAPVKSSTTCTGHAAGLVAGSANSGAGGGLATRGDGGGAQALSAVSDEDGTPAATMVAVCAAMHAASVAASLDATPASTKGATSAGMHEVHTLADAAHAAAAAVKFCGVDTGHVVGGGGGDGDGGGGGLGQLASAGSDA